MDSDRRAFLAVSAAAMASSSSRLLAQTGPVLRPEDFGARGDGASNDTRAFAALSAELNRRGGGTISLGRGKTYIVGAQLRGGQFGWTPSPILELRGLRAPLRILGNGARLKCQPGLRFGTFDRRSGARIRRAQPHYRSEEAASAYRGMLFLDGCRAPIEIRDIELDGNIDQLLIGGPYGDTGWQLQATGLWLMDNRESETVTNVFSHHHGQDGAIIDGDDRRSSRSRFTNFVARHNGRQGLSITGGRGYDFADCEFGQSGRSAIKSAPAAGVDIEAEGGKTVRDLTFVRCKFIDNSGVGLLAAEGDSAGARFSDCLFVGTTAWSAWPAKPRFTFERCTFAGALVNAFTSPDPALAAKFLDCLFTDDPALSPSRRLYFAFQDGGPVADLNAGTNVLFAGCRFELGHLGVLPWSWKATYRDCRMRQASRKTAYPRGRHLGRSVIDGPVDLYGSMIMGTVIVNGRQVPRGPIGVPAW